MSLFYVADSFTLLSPFQAHNFHFFPGDPPPDARLSKAAANEP